MAWSVECRKCNSCLLPLICIEHPTISSIRSVALEIVLQAIQSPKDPFQDPLTYGRKKEVICILVPKSYINLTYSSYTALTTLLHPGDRIWLSERGVCMGVCVMMLVLGLKRICHLILISQSMYLTI